MNTDDPNLPPPEPPPLPQPPLPAIPIALPYSSLRPVRTGIITATGVIGIIIGILGLIVAAFEALQAVMEDFMGKAVPAMQMQSAGAMTVSISEAIIGAVLAIVLLVGSSGLLRRCPWSRRVMVWWSLLYLASVVVFLLLQQLEIVVPSQAAMFTNIMTAIPATVPSTNPAGTVPTTNVSYSSYSVTVSGGATTTMAFPAAPVGGPSQAQMAAMMSYGYSILAYGKAIICVIFPIAVLIVMRFKSVRSALQAEPAV